MKIVKKKFKIFLILLTLSFLFSQVTLAGTFSEIMKGFGSTGSEAGYPQGSAGAPQKTFAQSWAIYANGMIGIISALFMIIIIYSGFLWMTAKGNEEQVNRAKTWILQATIGLALVIGARLIVELALFYLGKAIYPS
jgi:hypothetical protein